MLFNQFLLLAAVLFCIGVYGVMARKNAVMVLLAIELILNAVNLNLVAFGAKWGSDPNSAACASAAAAGQNCGTIGQVFGLFVIAVAAAEVGVGLAIVLMLFRNKKSVDLDDLDLMKG